jgi:ribonuclease P protein component
MRRPPDFAAAVRRGRRSGRTRLAVHLLEQAPAAVGEPTTPTTLVGPPPTTTSTGAGAPALVGFVVSKAVGTAVVRNRVQRRLRHLLRDRVASLPAGSRLVVRALPPAAAATSRELATDLDAALRSVTAPRRGPRRSGGSPP